MKITTPFGRRITSLLVAAGIGLNMSVAAAQGATAPAAPLPAAAFFKKPAIGSPRLSPSGKKIAMLVPTKSGRIGLAVADTATPDKFVGIAQFGDADVFSVSWVNDERLVFTATDRQATMGEQMGGGLYAVNSDGSGYLWLIERSHDRTSATVNPAKPPLSYRYQFVGTMHDGSDDVLVKRWIPTPSRVPNTVMMRLNTKSMTTRGVNTGAAPDGVQEWVLDRDLEPRVAVASDGNQHNIVYWRDKGSTSWSELLRYNTVEDRGAILPVAIDGDGQLYVEALNSESPDATTALYRYDVKQRKIDGKAVVSLPGFDFEGSMRFEGKQLLGVSYA